MYSNTVIKTHCNKDLSSKFKGVIVGLQSLTTAAIKDELTYQLSSKVTTKVNEDKSTGLAYLQINQKYYERAEFVLYRINIWDPCKPPVFSINCSDITPELLDELDRLKKSDSRVFDHVVTDAIQSLMEGINERYYHISGVAYKISWRFDP